MRKGFIQGSGIVACLLAMLVSVTTLHALGVPQAPPLDRSIIDLSETLTGAQIDQLAATINESRTEKAYQIGILIVPSLEGASLEEYSLETARTWGIGDSSNNGVLLLIAKDDRLMRIEVGSGLEGDLTDAESGRIIRNIIAPEFRDGRYYEGIDKAIQSIRAQVEKTADPNQAALSGASTNFSGLFEFALFGILIFTSWFGSILSRSKSWWAGGIIGGAIGLFIALVLAFSLTGIIVLVILTVIGFLFDYFVSKNFYTKTASGRNPSWWSGGTWIGGGGSGGGFGGGGFSGGGSSGGW